MSIKKNIIAIIPARGGSKGILKKNIINFLNKPLIVHSIDYAKSSDLISKVYISTDDSDIAKIGLENGAKIINRPSAISGDEASTESALLHALDNLNSKPDIIILLQPTSPLRPKNSLDEAINYFLSNNYDSLLSITPTHRFFWKIHNDKVSPQYDFKNRPRRQDIKKDDINYIENGSLYIFTYETLVNSKNRLGGKIGYTIFDEEYSFEIDTYTDLELLESIAKKLK